MKRPVALVPGVLALLPSYASIEDPVADFRAACLQAVRQLGPRVRVVASEATGGSGRRVAAALVRAVGADVTVSETESTGVLVVGNGSATRTEKAPGHFDPRAEAFDDGLRADLGSADPTLAAALWADVAALALLPPLSEGEVLFDAAPFGVHYWVAIWS